MQRNRILPWFVSLLWPVLDRLLITSYRIKPVRTDSIISVQLRRYKGYPITLGDGSKVKAGDKIIELHLNSAWFRQRRKLSLVASRLHWEALHCFAKDLSYLAEQMVNGMFDSGVTALHGVTLLHTGTKRLGFQVMPLPTTLWKKLVRFYLTGLMQIHHPLGKERLKAMGKPLEVKGVWLSRAELLRRYAPESVKSLLDSLR